MYSAEQLQVSGATSPGAGLTGDDCSLDYITIAGAGATAGADSSTYDRSWSRQLLGRIYYYKRMFLLLFNNQTYISRLLFQILWREADSAA